MTKVQIKNIGDTYTITARGHAGYNSGNDPVCAAISMLLLTLAQITEDLSSNNDAKIIKRTLKPGRVTMVIKSSAIYWKYAIKTAITGFELLEHQYPEHVLLTNKVGEIKKEM